MWEGEGLGHEGYSLCCGRGCLTDESWKCATDHFCQGEGSGGVEGGGGRQVSHVQSSKPACIPTPRGGDHHVQSYVHDAMDSALTHACALC